MVPLAFIPLLGGEVLALIVPTLGYLLIGDYLYQNSIRYQYTAPIVPFLFFAFVLGLERIERWNHRKGVLPRFAFQISLVTFIVGATLANYFFQSPGPFALDFDPAQYTVTERVALGYKLLAKIPPTAPVMAETNLVPHLSERRFIYQGPDVPNLRRIQYLLADTHFESYVAYKDLWDEVLTLPSFETITEQDGFILKRLDTLASTYPTRIQFDNQISLLGYSAESGEPARRGENTRLILTWRADQDIRVRYVTFVHLIDAQNQIWAQDDREPAKGWLPTDHWNTGDVTPDRFTLDLPADMPPGDYHITAGLYATTDHKTLTARDPSGKSLGSEPVLGILHVVANAK
jgi:hypothetical protein